jgi:hypothetical protein
MNQGRTSSRETQNDDSIQVWEHRERTTSKEDPDMKKKSRIPQTYLKRERERESQQYRSTSTS